MYYGRFLRLRISINPPGQRVESSVAWASLPLFKISEPILGTNLGAMVCSDHLFYLVCAAAPALFGFPLLACKLYSRAGVRGN